MASDPTHPPASRQFNFTSRVPDGDNRTRNVCDTCGFIDYVNPRLVAGAMVRSGDKILLCRRAIQPRFGFWTMPAGFMELHESVEMAARREAQEEACADITLDALLAVYSVPRISQVQMIFRATLNGTFAPGPESLDVRLFSWDEIPWDNLAFPSVHWALHQMREVQGVESFSPFSNPPGELGNVMPPAPAK